MWHTRTALGVIGILTLALLVSEPALAGPGGKIASALFDTFWGRVLMVALSLVFLPLITWVYLRERGAERRTRADLAYIAQFDHRFHWTRLQERVSACFHRVHAAWRHEDAAEAAQFMTDWYWQNQQLVYLDQWAEQGLVNHCQVKKVTRLRPMLFIHRNERGIAHEGSRLVVSITAYMQDYLAERAGGKVVEGSKRFKEVETLWSFLYEGGLWRVAQIDAGSNTLSYVEQIAALPPIEETLLINGMR